jgi:O-antigen/teichoic acid export membrane protein
MLFLALRNYLVWKPPEEQLNYREILAYLLPVAVSNFLVINLVSFDMVLVRYFFTADESGLYALAQIVGKIFLFLPSAISIVMFPRVSCLNAQSALTIPTLRKSLFYTLGLCLTAGLGYNFFPGFTLKVLTGKAASQVIGLGRLFSISMTLFALLAVLVTYFLSLKDFRFLKYLALSAILQFLAIVLFHRNLAEVQLILCFNAGLLFLVHLWLAYKNKG